MAEVIDLSRRQSREKKREAGRQRRRAEALASALACGSCPRRCAHCGIPMEEAPPAPIPTPYPFCGHCQEEYLAYRRRQDGEGRREAYWHNQAWEAMWRGWLEHMEAMEAFRRSPEFRRILDEQAD